MHSISIWFSAYTLTASLYLLCDRHIPEHNIVAGN